MNVYVWNDIQDLTQNYHSGGGMVVFAKSLENAIEMAKEAGVKFQEVELTPTETRKSAGTKEQIYIFPDAGCY